MMSNKWFLLDETFGFINRICVAKDLYLNTQHFSIAELADPIVIDLIRFRLIMNAMGIRRYGYSFLQCKVGGMS